MGEGDLDLAVERAQAGDARGFDVLFRTCSGAIVGYLAGRSVPDAEGLANEVFLRAFRTIHTFRGDGERFRAWLFTIAHHAAVDDFRRRQRRLRTVSLDEVAEAPAARDELDAMLEESELRALLDQLTDDQRDVLLLRIVGDLTVDQTAAALGKGHEAVKALQRRALERLRKLLSADEGVPK